MPANFLRPAGAGPEDTQDICLFAQTNFRNQMRRFGIKVDDRRRHMYIIGKTGMGKTTIMENMVLHDIYSGHGVGVVDPHGDFAEKIINFIPAKRINDVVYFNPADMEYPIGFNILEVKSEEQKHLVASGLMGIFKKIWPDVWSSRMEYILNNTILALLDYPGSTLLGINRLLSEKKYRAKVIAKLKDPVVKGFWQNEFASYNDRYAQEAVAPIQNKIGQFLSAAVIRNMVAQVKSTINVREIMDSQKIFIMNLSKGRIGEDNSRLLGGMLITQLQLAAMERVDTPEKDRKDFFLYVDEFQNFATPSFANILSEARKYRLSLIMAHQYVKQLDEVVADAVFGNVGTIVTFRVGGGDAEALAKEFTPTFMEEDIVNLAKYQIFLKLMIDGVASQPFSAMTMPPIGSPTGSFDKVVRVSRERYAKQKSEIEEKIMRWSGMESDEDDEFDVDTTAPAPKPATGAPASRPASPAPQRFQAPANKPASNAPRPVMQSQPAQAPRPTMNQNGTSQPSSFLSLKDLTPRENRPRFQPQGQSGNTQGSVQANGGSMPMSGGNEQRRKRKRKKSSQQQHATNNDPRPSAVPISASSPAQSFIPPTVPVVPVAVVMSEIKPTTPPPPLPSVMATPSTPPVSPIPQSPVPSEPPKQISLSPVQVTPSSEQTTQPQPPKPVEPGQIITFYDT